ncbi:MAG: cache domain-containing protein [Mangrovibacterium sp.]
MFDYFRILLIAFAIFSSLTVVSLLVIQQVKSYRESLAEIRAKKIDSVKQFVQNMVAVESDYVAQVKKSFDDRQIQALEKNVQEAYNVANTLYQENHDRIPKNELKRLIVKSISSLNSAGTRQQVLINTTDGRGVYNPNNPQFEGKNLLHMKDRAGSYFVQEELKIVKDRGEGFRYVSDTLAQEIKVVYVKGFPALDWYFVSVMYPSNYYDELIQEVASKVSVKFFDYKGDVFVYEKNGNAIAARGKVFHDGKRLNIATSKDLAAQNFYRTMTDSLEKYPEGAFMEYPWYARDVKFGDKNALSDKISYVVREPDLGWIVGAGFFVSRIDNEIEVQASSLRKELEKSVLQIVLLFVLIIILQLFFLRWVEKQFRNDFDSFVSFFKSGGSKLTYLELDEINSKEFKELGAVANEMIAARQKVENQLLKEQEKAKEADRLKSSVLANMSHEIKTPMNAIVGFSNFLSEDLSLEESRRFVALIKNSGDNLLSLIDSIIDFSKIEVGQLELKYDNLSYERLCEDLNDNYQRSIKEEYLNITFEIKNLLPVGFVSVTDEYRLRQILKHIIDNAFKFTPSGDVKLYIERNQNQISFRVTDTGIGISPENQECIFEHFAQAEGSPSPSYGSSGIGLAISARLVEMLGGKIKVESTLGKGSSFQFYIPLIEKK